jgi:hypothetical protein
MKFLLVFLCIVLCELPSLKAQFPSDSAEVSLITASPGEETYAAFGHTMLRVKDRSQGYDVVFNYGMFDFRTEHFYLKFSTGKLMYFLAAYDFDASISSYQQSGQAIYTQPINLTNQEKFKLINLLQENIREENRHFRYDFCRDNCATRVRDIIAKSIDGKIVLDSNYVHKRESFRQLFNSYLKKDPWIVLGLNLIMGKSTDSIASLNDYMYLPLHLKNLYASATVVSPEGTRKLTQTPVMLFPSTLQFKKPSPYTSPEFVCIALFVVVLLITIWEYRKKKYLRWLDVFLFLVTGLLGSLIFWLWGWSLHIYLHDNLHIVWATPLNLIAVVYLIFFSRNKIMHYYSAVYGMLVLLLIPVSFFITQEFHVASYFLMGIMLIRVTRIYLKFNDQISIS